MGLRPTKWDENPPKCGGAGCQPAADWESACRRAQRISNGLHGAFDRAAGSLHIRTRQLTANQTSLRPGDYFYSCETNFSITNTKCCRGGAPAGVIGEKSIFFASSTAA